MPSIRYQRRRGATETRKRSTPTADAPIPPAARPIIEAVHRRYHARPRHQRPDPDDGRAVAALLKAGEHVALAQAGYFPIPGAVIRLGMTPAEYQRQQTLDEVADQMEDAVLAVLEGLEA